MLCVYMDVWLKEFCIDRLENVERMRVGLVLLCFNSLPENGTQVPKHVAFDTINNQLFSTWDTRTPQGTNQNI
jgi:hypothetical protein